MDIFKKYVLEFKRYLIDISILLFFIFIKKSNNFEFTILTGSDSTHFKSLLNLLKSLSIYESNTNIKIINLGLDSHEIELIQELYNYEIIDFNFEDYPTFVSERDQFNKLGSYAWKPISIRNEFKESGKNVIWLDAGCVITKSLSKIKILITKNGFYSPESSDQVKKWTHLETIKLMKIPQSVLNKRNISGGIVGFSQVNSKSVKMLEDWYSYSIIKEVISPEGSSRLNHRQDQTLLTLLMHQNKLSWSTPRTHKMFGILKHQDVEN